MKANNSYSSCIKHPPLAIGFDLFIFRSTCTLELGSFAENQLKPSTGKFKDASIRYTSIDQINTDGIKQ